jgi:hypothetical protein
VSAPAAPVATNCWKSTRTASWPSSTEVDAKATVFVSPFTAAVAGAYEDSVPRPKAATATSAMRLKVVFVDICFLSISQDQEFPDLGFG